jgi:hypothetical protein
MAGPIMSGGKPRLEVLLFVVLVALLLVLMSPRFTSMIVRKLPWIAPLFHTLKSD